MSAATTPPVGRLVVAASGAINVANLHEYLLALRCVAATTTVVLTRAARALAAPVAVRAISGCAVHTDDDHHGLAVPHMELALWADLVIVLPATGNVIGKVANGIADDLVTSIVLAHDHPTIMVPSMNPSMWAKPALRRNVDRLLDDGHRMIVGDTPAPALETATGEWLLTHLMPAPAEVARQVALEAKAWATGDGTD